MENEVKETKKESFIKKNKNMVIAIGVVLVLAIAAIVLVMLNGNKTTNDQSKKEEEKIVANTSAGIIKEEEFQGLKFTNVTLVKEGTIYTLSMDVTNTTNETVNIKQVDIPVKDESGNTIITLLGYIGDDLKANETRTITSSTSADLSKASTKEIAENK